LNAPDNAVTLYGQALGTTRSTELRAFSLYGIAWTELSRTNPEGAAAAFGRLIDEAPAEPLLEQSLFWKGRLNYALGDFQNARDVLLKMSLSFPASLMADDAVFFAARAAGKAGDHAGAVETFNLLEQRFPQSSLLEQAHIERAECLLETGRMDEAVQEFARFIEQKVESPLRPLVLYDMGKALQRAGKFEEAIEQYRAAAGGEKNEIAARARFAVAECLAELDRRAEAVEELTIIARGGFPAGWEERALLQTAMLLERDGMIEEARHLYSAVVASYPEEAAGMAALKALNRLTRNN
jgi:TolA-binding protein